MQNTGHADLPEIDTGSLAFDNAPHSVIEQAGATRGLARGPHGVEVFDYAVVKALLTDKRFRPPSAAYFQGRGATAPVLEFINDGLLLMMDPARHEKVRRVMVKGFKPSTIASSRTMMAQFAGSLLDGLATRGHMDFVGDFSHHYSVGVISRYIGVAPEDVPIFEQATVELRVLAENPMTPHVPRLERALASIRTYTEKLVAERQSEHRTDLISDLIEAQESEGHLTQTELVWAIANLLLAGHDTTRFQLASCVRAIIDSGEWETLARQPELIPAAVEEGMRLWPVTARVVRLTLEPLEIAGEAFGANEPVALSFQAAGRDPKVFEEPNRLRLNRDTRWDIGFGRGAHYCLGHAVAHMEMCVALQVLTQRLTHVRLDGELEPSPPSAAFMRGVERLPLRFDLRKSAENL